VASLGRADTFDVRRNQTLPEAQQYDSFLIGINASDSGGNALLKTFLAGFDFWDGTVVLFWMDRTPDNAEETEIGTLIQGAWVFINGRAFQQYRGVNQREIDRLAAGWMEGLRIELAMRKNVGGYAGEVVKAFAAAFPDRITGLEFRLSADGGAADWYFNFDGVPYAYAAGRFLPVDEISQPKDFRPLSVYRYRRQADDPETEDRWNKLASQVKSRRNGAAFYVRSRPSFAPDAGRSPFYETLYNCRTRAEAYEQQEWISFLDRRVHVHRMITAPLAAVEARILELEKTDETVALWKKQLYSITAWNWRNVAGSTNRSYHSYGIAIDLLEKSQPGKETYWQWTRDKGLDWQAVSAGQRLDPPLSVICAFEEQGFIWGGSWPWYDTMHFEYRPELLILGS
jgi:hypothetical protein